MSSFSLEYAISPRQNFSSKNDNEEEEEKVEAEVVAQAEEEYDEEKNEKIDGEEEIVQFLNRNTCTSVGFRVNPTLHSRINLLQKKLVFRGSSSSFDNSSHSSNGNSVGNLDQRDSHISPLIKSQQKIQKSIADSPLPASPLNSSLLSRKSFNRRIITKHNNIRKELAQSNGKYSAIAKLFQSKLAGLNRKNETTNENVGRDEQSNGGGDEACDSKIEHQINLRLSSNQNCQHMNDDRDDDDCDNSRLGEIDDFDQAKRQNYSSIPSDTIGGGIKSEAKSLRSEMQQCIIAQRGYSFALREYFRFVTDEDKSNSNSTHLRLSAALVRHLRAAYIGANQSLLIAALRYEMLRAQIDSINRNNLRQKGKNSSLGGGSSASLLIRKICIPGLSRRSAAGNMHFLLIIRHDGRLIESTPIIVENKPSSSSSSSSQYTLQFNIDQKFDQLTRDFHLTLQLYQIDTSIDSLIRVDRDPKRVDCKFAKNWWKLAKVCLSKKSFSLDARQKRIAGLIKLLDDPLSCDVLTTWDLPHPATSAFKPIGSIVLDRTSYYRNLRSGSFTLHQFDYCWSTVSDSAKIDCELTIDFGESPLESSPTSSTFDFAIKSNSFDCAELQRTQLLMSLDRLQFSKCRLRLSEHWLQLVSPCGDARKMESIDLATCINCAKTRPTIVGLRNTLLLIFASTNRSTFASIDKIWNEKHCAGSSPLSAQKIDFQLLFISCGSRENDSYRPQPPHQTQQQQLDQLYRQLMTRVHLVRQWPKTSDEQSFGRTIAQIYQTLLDQIQIA